MQMLKKLSAVVLAVVMLLSLASCSDTTWVAKKGETEITSGMYLGMLVNAYSQAQNLVEDTEKSLFKQKIEDIDSATWIKNTAKELLEQHIGVEIKFAQLGLSVSEEDIASAQANIESYWDYMTMYEDNGCGLQSYMALNQNSYKGNQVFDAIYGAGGEKEISEQEIKDYFASEYVRFKYIVMPKRDGSGNDLDEAGVAELKTKAEGYLARLQAGERIDTMIDENQKYYLELSAAASGTPAQEAEPSDPDSNYVILPKTDAQHPEQFVSEIFAAQNGVPTLIDSEQYFFVAVRYDILEKAEDLEAYTSSVMYAMKQEEFQADMAQLANDGGEIEYNNASLRRYNPKNIKI